MAVIERLHAREVLDSRGRPTVEVEVFAGGAVGRASVPSGASTGTAEAHELRDGEPERYRGLGVRRAVEHVRGELADAVRGCDPRDQRAVDQALLACDGSAHKARLGANAILGVSLAAAHAAAALRRQPLFRHLNQLLAEHEPGIVPAMPVPMVNMISGGLHAGGNLDFQDVLVSPAGAPDYPTALEWTVRIYQTLGEVLSERGFEGRLVGDEGGYGPRLDSNAQAVQLTVEAIRRSGLQPRSDVCLALDVAATHFHHAPDRYQLQAENRVCGRQELIDLFDQWVAEFPIASIEDGLAEDDWEGWKLMTQRLGERVRLVGDDLFATNPQRLRRGIESQVANAVLIKMNQIGTLSETLAVIAQARAAGYALVVSARSGETEDTTLADLAVAVAADQIKIGSIVRSERLAKYNQLLRIDEQLRGASS